VSELASEEVFSRERLILENFLLKEDENTSAIIKLRMDGYSAKEISEKLGKNFSIDKVTNMISTFRVRFGKFLSKSNY
jgi:transposase